MMPRNPLARLRFLRDHRFTEQHASDYLDGDLPARGRRRIEEHASMCPHCRRMLETLRQTLKGLAALREAQTAGVAASVIERLRAQA
jgi:predicted anti-sigma-YlaC factor YlaD